MNDEKPYKTIAAYDAIFGGLDKLPDVTRTQPTTIVTTSPVIGAPMTFIVQTLRQAERGDTVFVQYIDAEGSYRIAMPPRVADAIARQRDALTTKVRRAAGKRTAQARAARGELPGFMKKKRRKQKPEISDGTG